MRFLGEDSFEQQCGVYSDLLGPVHHARGRPLQMRLVTLWTVLPRGEHLFSPATTEMRGHTLALVEDLHGRCVARLPRVLEPVYRAHCRG